MSWRKPRQLAISPRRRRLSAGVRAPGIWTLRPRLALKNDPDVDVFTCDCCGGPRRAVARPPRYLATTVTRSCTVTVPVVRLTTRSRAFWAGTEPETWSFTATPLAVGVTSTGSGSGDADG